MLRACSVRACVLRAPFVGTYGNLWELMGIYGNLWERMGTYGNLWELMGTYGNLVRENLWELMGTYGNLWEHVGTCGNLWELRVHSMFRMCIFNEKNTSYYLHYCIQHQYLHQCT